MIRVQLIANDGKGVDYDQTLDTYLNDFVSNGFPFMETDDQIVVLSKLAGKNTKVFVLDGSNMDYDLGTHTVSGDLDTITIGTYGDSYNADGSFDTDGNDHITGYERTIVYSGLDAANGADTRGDFHEIVAELIYLGGMSARGTPTFDAVTTKGGQDVTGTNYADTYTGTDSGDIVDAMGGNDKIKGGGGNDELAGGGGNDTVKGGSGKDDITGDGGADRLEGGGGADTVDGGAGNDLIKGNGGNDDLTGGTGRDTVQGGGGKDTIDGGGDSDKLFGDAGKDQILGGGGNDTIDGGAGADNIKGGGGSDHLMGDRGSDTLKGGNGNDILDGGNGRDFLFGGRGNDTFDFTSTKAADRDKIEDFSKNDLISLVDIDANEGKKGNQSFDFIGDDKFSGTAGELQAREKGSHTIVSGDTDGNGKADFSIKVADFSGITESDFLL